MELGGNTYISRDSLDLNESLLEPLIQRLGTRVGVDTIFFHVESLFHMMSLPTMSP